MTLLSLGILDRLNHWLQLSLHPSMYPPLPAMASVWMELDYETCFNQGNMTGGQCVTSEPALKRPCMFCSLSCILSPPREKLHPSQWLLSDPKSWEQHRSGGSLPNSPRWTAPANWHTGEINACFMPLLITQDYCSKSRLIQFSYLWNENKDGLLVTVLVKILNGTFTHLRNNKCPVPTSPSAKMMSWQSRCHVCI